MNHALTNDQRRAAVAVVAPLCVGLGNKEKTLNESTTKQQAASIHHLCSELEGNWRDSIELLLAVAARCVLLRQEEEKLFRPVFLIPV